MAFLFCNENRSRGATPQGSRGLVSLSPSGSFVLEVQ